MKINNLFKKEDKNLEIPNVIFEDVELQIVIAQSFRIIPVEYRFKRVDIKELVKNSDIILTKSVKKELSQKFSQLLNNIGIDSTETCIISNTTKDEYDNYTFNCHLENANEDAKITLNFISNFTSPVKFTIDYNNTIKNYCYYDDKRNGEEEIKLEYYNKKNNKNGNIYSRHLFSAGSCFEVKNDKYCLNLLVEELESDDAITNELKLKNDKDLEQFLLDLSFPIEIDKLYKNICEISVDDISKYSIFSLKL